MPLRLPSTSLRDMGQRVLIYTVDRVLWAARASRPCLLEAKTLGWNVQHCLPGNFSA